MAIKTHLSQRWLNRVLSNGQRPSKWWVVFTVTLSSFLVNVSQNAVQVALPPIMTTFGLDIDQAQWLITGYIISGAMLMPTIGWLGNRLGNRTLYLLCMLSFCTGAVLCAASWSGVSLIIFRVLQGLGGGLILPMTMTIATDAFPHEQRGLAIGIIGIGIALGPALGPVFGGYVTDFLSWRMVFLLTVIPGLMCMLLTLVVLPNTRETQRRSLDLMGLLLMSITVVSLLVALSQSYRHGWESALIQNLLLTAGLGLLLLIVWELHTEDPLIDLRIYQNRVFGTVSILLLLFFTSFATSNFWQTILVQRLFNYPPSQAGLVLLPGGLVLMILFPIAGRLSDLIDRRLIMVVSIGLLTLSAYEFTFLSLGRSLSWMMWIAGLRFVAAGLFYTAAAAAALSELSPDQLRMGSGLLNLVQNGLGGTLGLAAGATILQRRLNLQRDLLDQQQSASNLSWRELTTPVFDWVHESGAIGPVAEAQVEALVHRQLNLQAMVAAYQDSFSLLVGVGATSMVLLLLLRKPRAR